MAGNYYIEKYGEIDLDAPAAPVVDGAIETQQSTGNYYTDKYGEIEIAAPPAPEPVEDDYGWGIIQAFKRGTEMLTAMPDIAQGDHEELAGHFQRMEELGRSDEDTAKLRKIQEADGWWDTTVEIFKNPALTMQVVAESLPNMLAPAAGGLAGGAAAGPFGMMGGAALGSFATEYMHGLSNFLAEEGVDMTDGQALKAAFANDELMLRAREKAATGGIPVAIFDGLSFGLAGKIYKVAEGGSLAVRTAGRAGEAAMQSGFGAAGEAGKQLLTEGEITSEADVLFEAFAELPGTISEPIIARVVRGRRVEQDTDPLAQQLDADLTDEQIAEMETVPGSSDALALQATRSQDARTKLQETMARDTAFEQEEQALAERTLEEAVRENNRVSMAFMENEAERSATLDRHYQEAEVQKAAQETELQEKVEAVNAEPMPGTSLGEALTAAQEESGTEIKTVATPEPEPEAAPEPTKPVKAKPAPKEEFTEDTLADETASQIESLHKGSTLQQKRSANKAIIVLKKSKHARANELRKSYNAAVAREDAPAAPKVKLTPEPIERVADIQNAGNIQSESGYVYHATNEENLTDILNEGTVRVNDPDFGTDQDAWPDGTTEQRSYWSEDANIVKSFAPVEGKSVAIRVRKKAGDFKKERGTGDMFSREAISAENIEFLNEKGQWVQPTPTSTPEVQNLETVQQEAATSPENDMPQPTKAQKEAGNYKKAHIKVQGLDISVENPVGSTRRGNKMKDHYGYIKRTEDADGDQVDVFVNPKIKDEGKVSRPVEIKTDNPGGEWLEHQRERAKETGYLGDVTGYLKGNEPVMINPKFLEKIAGARGEHKAGANNQRGVGDKAKRLRESIRSGESIREPVFVTVDYKGTPLISEGNNRVAVAIQEGLTEIPVEVRWFAGGEQVDGALSPNKLQKFVEETAQSPDNKVYVIDQTKEDGVTFDEHKVMLGYKNKLDATRGYKRNYDKGWKVGPITEMTTDEFKSWLKTDTTKPIQDVKTAKPSREARRFVRDKKGKVRYSLRGHKKSILADAKKSNPAVDSAFLKHVIGQPSGTSTLPGMTGPVDTEMMQRMVDRVLESEAALAPTKEQINTEIQEAVAKVNKRFPDANIMVVDNAKEVGRDISKRARGMFVNDTNEIYLFTDNLTSPEAATRTALHEMAHKGLRTLLGDDFRSVMMDVYQNLSSDQQKALDAIANIYQLDLNVAPDQRLAAEELVAKLAESNPKHSAVQKVVAAVRKILRKMGLAKDWTTNDIINLIAEAKGSLRRRQPLSERTMTEQVQVEETGEIFEVETNAEVVLRQHDKRVNVVKQLRACL